MGLHRRSEGRRTRAVVSGVVVVALAVVITSFAVHHALTGASSVASSRRAESPGSSPPTGLSAQSRFKLSKGNASPAPDDSKAPATPPAAASPASLPGSIPGWRLVYGQDFNGSALPSGWGPYTGQPGGDPNGQW